MLVQKTIVFTYLFNPHLPTFNDRNFSKLIFSYENKICKNLIKKNINNGFLSVPLTCKAMPISKKFKIAFKIVYLFSFKYFKEVLNTFYPKFNTIAIVAVCLKLYKNKIVHHFSLNCIVSKNF